MERTRLFIKNLPKHLTDERFRQHFESKGLVTDAKILRTKDGESRKIGFIGFKDEKAAATAQKFFNKTFIDTSRIIVEIALPKGDKHLPRPWSKYSEGSSRFEQKAKNQIKEEKKQRKKEEKKKMKGRSFISQAREMEEFASLMKKRSATKLWANDEAAAATQRGQRRGGGKKEDEGEEEQEVSSSSSGEEGERSTNEQEGETDNIEDQEESGSNGKEEEVEEEEADSVVLNKAVSDMDYLRSKMSSSTNSEDDGKGEKIAEESDDSDEEEGKGGGGGADSSDEDSSSHHQLGPGDDRVKNRKGRASKTAKQGDTAGEAGEESGAGGEEEGSGDEEAVDTDRLFVRNLPFSVGEEELRALFGAHGEVADLHRPLDEARRPRGFAFVRFLLPEAARRARAALDRRPFQGRLLHVLPAQRLALGDDEGEAAAGGQSSYKARREAERRAKAGDRTGWSAAHVRGDAVVGAVARRLGLARGQVLGPDAEGGEGESLAVRLAVGETHVLQENRDYFLKEPPGVDLAALESPRHRDPAGQRSRTALLVKNLPHTTGHGSLEPHPHYLAATQLFERFGTLGRLLLPPSRTVALVEFVEATEARKAFKSLAYKRFQHVPLYLEWAPIKVSGHLVQQNAKEAGKIDSSNRSSSDNVKDVAESMLPKEDEGEASTLYVKNLNFNTTEENLKKAFQGRFADFRAVSIPRKKKGNKILSMGYGFVEFASKTGMETAMKEMQNYKLEGHALQLKPSSAKKSSGHPENAPKSDEQSTKIMVRNLAFQATAKEVRALFSEFGELKKVRLPKKFDGNNRGFAFVEFLTAKEARAAFSALASTHLSGRHLV
ncbi:unnamed protein product, partial [Heterosigma akashiwo]